MGRHIDADGRPPDESGWYWTKDEAGEWAMAYVDADGEAIWRFPAASYTADVFEPHDPHGIREWHGPIVCPGGDFGGITVLCDEDLRREAETQNKVIGIKHFDFRHCDDEKHGAAITVSGLYSREEAIQLAGIDWDE